MIAADAGPMGIEWRKGAMSRCAGVVRRSTEDNAKCRWSASRTRVPENNGWKSWKAEVCREARRREIARAEARKGFVMSMVVSCGNRDWERWRTEFDFGSSESLDGRHRSTALGAKPKIVCTGGASLLCGLCCWR